jgi:spore coat protein A
MKNWRPWKTVILAVAGIFLMGSVSAVFADPLPGGTLDPTMIPQYVTPLVIPPVMNNDGTANQYQIAVRQFKQQILPGGIWNTLNGRDDTFPATTIWSYGPASDPTPTIAPEAGSQFNYPAYTIETMSGTEVNVRWINELVQNPDICYNDDGTRADLPGAVAANACRFRTHLLPIDQTLHWANPPRLCIDGTFRTDCRGFIPERYMGPVPIVTHVHGAHVEGHSDGYPEAWWLPAAINIPAGYATEGTLFDDANGQAPGNSGYADYKYRNDQPAATLWYHDHSLGMTRSNVYAGPAGFWLIRGGNFDVVTDTRTDTFGDGVLPGPAPVAGEGVIDVNVTNRAKYRAMPIAIQDRSFNTDGSLFYPDNRAFFEDFRLPREVQIPFIPNSRSDISPIWNPEAFFNVMVVNGVAWPKLEVAQALYRFRFLDGCNSRFLWLKFDNPNVKVWQIGAEQGFLPAPVNMNALNLDGTGDGKAQILMALAERADVIVDFRDVADTVEIELLNIGPDEPFGGGIPGVDFDPADPSTTGRVMKFVVNADLNGESPTDPTGDNPATPPQFLALSHEGPLGEADEHRNVSLNEESSAKVCATVRPNGNIIWLASVKPGPDFEEDCAAAGGEPFGPKAALLGTVDNNDAVGYFGQPLMWTDDSDPNNVEVAFTLQNGTEATVNVTENPTVGDTEEWSIHNFTEDAHPIHLHLVRFQVVNREGYDPNLLPDQHVLSGVIRAPEPWEAGYKDTVIAYPGEVTRVKALFDIVGLYVWHCHIVEHEDNEMMRPYYVSPAPSDG